MRWISPIGVLCMLAVVSSTTSPAAAEWFADLSVGEAFTGARDVTLGSAGPTFRDVTFDSSLAVGSTGVASPNRAHHAARRIAVTVGHDR